MTKSDHEPSDQEASGPEPTLQSLLATAGMTEDDIDIWLSATTDAGVYADAARVLQWAAFYGDQNEARSWHDSDFIFEDALRWSGASFSIAESTELRKRFFDMTMHVEDGQAVADQETAWLESGLPPAWIFFFLDCGVTHAAEAQDIYTRALTDPDEVVRLGLVRALNSRP